MNLLVVSMGVAAGIGIDAALTHGLAGLSHRPRDGARLAFAAAAIAAAVGALSAAALYSVNDPVAHVNIMKWLLFPASAAWTAAAVWLVAFFTGLRPLRFLLALTAGFCLVVAIDLLLPYGLYHSGPIQLRTATMFGSDVLLTAGPSPHWANVFTNALTAAAFVFLYYVLYKVFRRGERRKAAYLTLAVALFSLTILLDILTDYGVISSLYLTQLCFAGVVVTMSVALRRESLQDEAELRAYRTQLESLVDARVKDLDKATERLEVEVGTRLSAEESLHRRLAELDALQHISQTLADRTDLAAALDEACGEVTALFTARYSRTYLLDDDTAARAVTPQSDENEAVAGTTAAEIRIEEIPVFRQTIDGREPVAVEDPASALLPPDLAALARTLDARHLLLVPMVARGEVVGVLAIARNGLSPTFSSREATLAKTVADTLGAVVENERLHQQETRQAAQDERQRLARDLHDAVTQSIYSASLIAEALPAVWEREPDEGRHNLVRLRRLVRAALAEMRTLLFELRPGALEAAPLDTLLERLGDALSGQVQIPVDVSVTDEHHLPSDVKITFYRVAQEAFSNIAKHARASQVTASLTADKQQVVLTVVDDGRGFDPEAIEPERMGLRIMRERLDRIGASLEVGSEPDRGTRLVAAWPRPAVEERPEDGHPGDARLRGEQPEDAAPTDGEGRRELSGSHSSAHSR